MSIYYKKLLFAFNSTICLSASWLVVKAPLKTDVQLYLQSIFKHILYIYFLSVIVFYFCLHYTTNL